jgi:AraC-like DNA-binding protein
MGLVSAAARPSDRLLPVPGRTAESRDPAEALLANVVCEVVRAGSWLPVPEDWRLRGHTPASHVVLLGTGGAAEYVVDGSRYHLEAGGLLLCRAGVWREGRHDPVDPLHLYSVHFRARLYGVLDLTTVYRLPTALSPTPERHAQMVFAAQRVVDALSGELPGQVLAADGACMELLALIWREVAEGGTPPEPAVANLSRLAPVFRLIEERYGEALSLPGLASTVGLGPAYFSTFFKRTVGVAPMRYVTQYRLSRVRELLVGTDLPVDAVASQTGFADGAYLSRVFRAAEGVPPSEYRRAQRSPTMS